VSLIEEFGQVGAAPSRFEWKRDSQYGRNPPNQAKRRPIKAAILYL
jgi:hypothetical protein